MKKLIKVKKTAEPFQINVSEFENGFYSVVIFDSVCAVGSGQTGGTACVTTIKGTFVSFQPSYSR